MVKISVVIPVYNVAEFVGFCLDSVLSQTLRDIEVICVDDGSEDDSSGIILKYAGKDPRVKLLRQKNQGAGKARNAGMRQACGEFIAFMDPDDFYPSSETLLHMYQAAKTNGVDICGGSLNRLKDGQIEANSALFEDGYTFQRDGMMSYGEYQFDYGYWRFIYRRAFLQDNKLEFPDYRRQQDPPFMVSAFCLAKNFYALKEPTYVYRVAHKGIQWNERKARDLFSGVYDVLKCANRYGLPILFERVARRLNTWTYRTAAAEMLGSDSVRKRVLEVLDLVLAPQSAFSISSEELDDIYQAILQARGSKPMVSVIVPVYNVEKFLPRCIDSILGQSFKSFELICVDDGSTDGSARILADYSAKDDRVHILKKANGGLSAARNYGLDRATAPFVMFVDSDDWIDPLTLEKSIVKMCGTIDIVCWGAKLEDDGVGHDCPNMVAGRAYHTIRQTGQKKICDDVILKSTFTAWNKLYKRKIFNDFEIRFCEGRLFEDNDVVIMYLSHCRDAWYLSEYLYHYSQRPGSIMERMRNPDFSRSADNLYIFDNLYRHLERYDLLWENRKVVNSRFCYHLKAAYKFALPTQKSDIRKLAFGFAKTYDSSLFREGLIDRLKNDESEGVPELNDIIVSLTSFPARIQIVDQVIQSLQKQSFQPTKIVLWLARSQFPQGIESLPGKLTELIGERFEIGWCEDTRSYKKLIPTLEKYPDAVIVTVDDDVVYEKNMLRALVDSYAANPEDVHCHRISKFLIDASDAFKVLGGGAHYYPDGSYLNKLVGVGGVLYPARCFHEDILRTDLFSSLAPTNDDQWFWAMAVLAGRKIRMVGGLGTGFRYIEGSQNVSLCSINDHGENLFWKDFNRIIGYYPRFAEQLRAEWASLSDHHNDNVDVYRDIIECWYLKSRGEVLDLDHPRTYNEKIQWLKVFDSTKEKTRLSDKYLVREWVSKRIGKEYLIPLIGAYDSFDQIDFDALPERFVMKCNHGCAYNIIVKNKGKLDKTDARAKIDKWMRDDFSLRPSREYHYRDIPHKIIIEQFIENAGSGGDLYDYKFWCFGGKVAYIQFLSERNLGGLKMAFYDKQWRKQSFVYNVPLDEKVIPKPDNLDQMIELAEKLSSGFAHVRVDFYRLDDGTIYFGEMTFTSASGGCSWNDQGINRRFGDMIKLPPKAYNIDTGKYFDPIISRPGISTTRYLYNEMKRMKKDNSGVGAMSMSLLRLLSAWRLDCKCGLKEVKELDVVKCDDGVDVIRPQWLKDHKMNGCSISSSNSVGRMILRPQGDGEIVFVLRGQDIRTHDGSGHVQFYVDVQSLEVNGADLLTAPVVLWYGDSREFRVRARRGEDIAVTIKSVPHAYRRGDLRHRMLAAKLPMTLNAAMVDKLLNCVVMRPLMVADTRGRQQKLEKEMMSLRHSEAYRVGMFVTWPARRASRMLKCWRKNGLKYTLRRLILGKGRGRK